jgi:hypothetical protein
VWAVVRSRGDLAVGPRFSTIHNRGTASSSCAWARVGGECCGWVRIRGRETARGGAVCETRRPSPEAWSERSRRADHRRFERGSPGRETCSCARTAVVSCARCAGGRCTCARGVTGVRATARGDAGSRRVDGAVGRRGGGTRGAAGAGCVTRLARRPIGVARPRK